MSPPALIQALRFVNDSGGHILTTLQGLTKADIGPDWHDWMLWQEERSDVVVFVGYDAIKADVMAWIDPNFRVFLYRGVKHEIRLEEIAWGGVSKDGIPALNNPKHISAAEAAYITDDELVFGVEINGDARAYPLRMMDWHEMFNDVVGGVPVALRLLYVVRIRHSVRYRRRGPRRSILSLARLAFCFAPIS